MAQFDIDAIHLPQRVRAMQLITFSLMAGVAIFALITFYVVDQNAPLLNLPFPVLSIAAAVFLLQALVLVAVLPGIMDRSLLRQLASGIWPPRYASGRPAFSRAPEPAAYFQNDAGRLLAGYGSQLILRLAMLEGAALVGVMGHWLEGNQYALVVPGVALGLMAALFPTQGGAIRWVETRLERLEWLRAQGEAAPTN